MKTIWAKIVVVSQVLFALAAVATLVLLTCGFFTDKSFWGSLVLLLMLLFSLPDNYDGVVQSIRSPKPRPSPRLLLNCWPLLVIAFMIVASPGIAVGFGFGSVWMGILAALGFGFPMIALVASTYMLGPGPKKDRAYLACTVSMFAIPLLLIIACAVVYGTPGR